MRRRPRRFALLAAAQIVAGLASIPFAIMETSAIADQRAQGLLVVGWLLLAAFTLLAAPRLPPWAYVASLAATSLLVALSTAIAAGGQVQVLEGFGILVVGVVAAYQLHGWWFHGFLLMTSALYALAVWHNPLVVGVWVVAVIVGLAVALPELVHRQLEELRAISLLDPLTGALNRKGLDETAPTVRALAHRAGQQTAVAVIDLDRFKDYNDTHGHRAGDQLLVSMVEHWRAGLRPSDLVARVGGDEFVLVLPASSPEDAAFTLDRLHRTSPARWTAGLCPWRDGEDIMDAVDRADRLMYESKNPASR